MALAHEVVERGAHGEAGHAEVGAQLPLRGNRVADRELLDEVEHQVARRGLLRHVAHRSGAVGSGHDQERCSAQKAIEVVGCRWLASARRSDAPVAASKKWKRDGSTARRSDPPTRAAVRGSTRAFRSEPRSVTRSAVVSSSSPSVSAAILRRVDTEEHVRIRAELLEHDDLDVDRRQLRRRERRVLERLGANAEDHGAALTAFRPPGRVELDAELPERDLAVGDGRLDEVHRRRADEAGDEEVARLLVQGLRRVDLEDVPVPHDGDALAQRHRLDLVVGDVHRRDAELLMELGERRAHPDAELRVEVRQRFVHEEGLRLAHDRAPHGDALALPAGELRGLALQELREPEELGDLVDASADVRLRHPPHLQAVAEVLANAHVRVQGVALEDHGDVAVSRREVGHVAAADPDLARRHLLEAGDGAEERRLTAARRADERDELAVPDVERDVVDGHDVAREHLRDASKLDLGHELPGMDTTFPHNWY